MSRPSLLVRLSILLLVVTPVNPLVLEQEGVRRTICDMALIIFHLVFSAFTFEGVDMSMAEKIINYNLKRYPNGARPSWK
jgi:hypothetical protein